MEKSNADFTLVFRSLSDALLGNAEAIRKLFDNSSSFNIWLERWLQRIELDTIDKESIAKTMNKVNPIYVPRNHKVEEALRAAVLEADMIPFSELLEVLSNPYEEIKGKEGYASPAPITGIKYQTFCGT